MDDDLDAVRPRWGFSSLPSSTRSSLVHVQQASIFRSRAGLRTFASLSDRNDMYAPILGRALDQILMLEASLGQDWHHEVSRVKVGTGDTSV